MNSVEHESAVQRVRAAYTGARGASWERIERERPADYFEANAVLARRHARAILLDWLQERPLRAVLDAGCGLGSLAAALARLKLPVRGVDLIARFIEAASRRAPQASFECADLLGWSPDARFDAVVLSEVLEDYDFQTQRAFLAQVCRWGSPRLLLVLRLAPAAPWKWLAPPVPALEDPVPLLRWIHGHVPYRLHRQTMAAVRHYRLQLFDFRLESGTGGRADPS